MNLAYFVHFFIFLFLSISLSFSLAQNAFLSPAASALKMVGVQGDDTSLIGK